MYGTQVRTFWSSTLYLGAIGKMMTPEHTKQLLRNYRKLLARYGANKLAPDSPSLTGGYYTTVQKLEHMAWMCEEALTFVDEKFDKAQRWLGFIQGILWATNLKTISKMRDESRSPEL